MLILDDEKEICQWLKTILIREGYSCQTVQTADEALDHLSKNEVNLVLADIWLQKQSGLEVLKKNEIGLPRNRHSHEGTRILLFSKGFRRVSI